MDTVSTSAPAPSCSNSFLLEKLSEFIENRMGLYFPEYRLNDLERAIRSAAGEFGFSDIASCMKWLLSSPLTHSQLEMLAGYLTIGETYFFRDKRVFEILETSMLPGIFSSRKGKERHLRLWSAGCSTGEEAYSLGIVLERACPDLKNWDITILATDIAPLSLKKALAGIYSEWSFRDTPPWVKQTCFKRSSQKFEIATRFKQMVTFSLLNLAEDLYPAIINNTNAMDIIFCRNVLMYFSQDRAMKVIDGLVHCLADGGWLVVSPIESHLAALSPHLSPVNFQGALLYKKEKKHTGQPKHTSKISGKTHDAGCSIKTYPASAPLPPGIQVRLLADQGKFNDALAICGKALQADKMNPSLYYLQASIFQELSRTEDAAASLQRAVYIDQEFIIAHFSLGHLLQNLGKNDQACKHLEKALSLLKSCSPQEVPPESEGITAGRLIELIHLLLGNVPVNNKQAPNSGLPPERG